MSDDRLEEAFRASLRERAGDVTADGGIAEVARTSARRRQQIKVAVAGAAAVAVIAPVGVLAALNREGGPSINVADPAPSSDATTDPGATDPTSPPGNVPENWRVESYNGVQLRVPPHWGWGGAPSDETFRGSDEFLTCGRGAFAYPGSDGETLFKEGVDMPYVGRANYYMTDVCIGGLPPPTHPYVWLGSPLEVGTVMAKGGFVQETVEVGGVRVTIWTDDADELATILGTLEAVEVDANGCDAEVRLQGPWDGLDGVNAVRSVSVCVYRHDERFLGYSSTVTGAAAEHLLEAVKDTRGVILDCEPDPVAPSSAVVLRFHGKDGTADVLARLDRCGGYDTGAEGLRRFTRSNVGPWIVDGVGLYVSGGMAGNALSGLYSTPSG